MLKKFFTYEQQLNKLQNGKQLTIIDLAYAEDVLEKLSYYSLIGGYKNLFKHSTSGKYVYGVTFEEMHQLITIVVRCRNVCAHGERLYSFRIRETIPDMPLHDKLKIPKKNGHYVCGKSDLYAVVIALRYLIGNDDFKKFKRELLCSINSVLKKCPHLSKKRLLDSMGFQENWDKILRYKKF